MRRVRNQICAHYAVLAFTVAAGCFGIAFAAVWLQSCLTFRRSAAIQRRRACFLLVQLRWRSNIV